MTPDAIDPPPWETQNSRTRYKNRWLTVVVDDVVLPNGKQYKYTRLEPAGIGVGVLAFDPAGRILLEREYRHGVGEVIWQIPGGLTNDGEHLRDAGLRELLEETGYAPVLVNDETVRYLGMVWDNPAFGTATSHIYAAWGVEPAAGGHHDPAEFVVLDWVEPAWLREAVRSGEVKDRVVVAAVAFLLLNGWLP
jgi:ADP-ribose pyrophosphatase